MHKRKLFQSGILIGVGMVLIGAIIAARSSDNLAATTNRSAGANPQAQETIDDETGFFITEGVLHSVPLNEIIFDTFSGGNRALPYDQASARVIENLRDQIAPLCEAATDLIPRCLVRAYERVADADEWMDDANIVIGFIDDDGQAYAYPFNILNFHEIVNDTLAAQPVLISYCPLCNSAVVYARDLDGETLLFGNTSALYENDLVMYDQGTDSYWYQVGGEAILGELTGSRLTPLPSIVSTWAEWRSDHPDSRVLVRPRQGIDYRRNPFGTSYQTRVNRGNFAFGVSDDVRDDDRLPAGTNVLMLQIGSDVVAYPVDVLGDAAITDEVGGQQIVVLSREAGPAAAAYETTLDDGRTVDLIYDAATDNWRDQNSDSLFDLSGTAIAGDLEGTRLMPVATRFTMWFAAVATQPNVVLYDAG